MIRVRRAAAADIPQMSRVLIASITELCAADHGHDPEAIAGWTANKRPNSLMRMLARPPSILFVAERDGAIAGVGMVQDDTVALNYVDPAHRFAGVSKALLAHMEGVLRLSGVVTGKLVSTATAHDFYCRAGWVDLAEGSPAAGYPMEKSL